MGRLIDGEWVKGTIISSDKKGAYDRQPRSFRDTISADHSEFKPESGRYHLYVSYACPWAHRALIYRVLKELSNHITVNVVHPDMLEWGWSFAKDFAGATGDELFGCDYLHQVYQQVQSDISTSATVPILFDKQTKQIVNNESSEIIRIFNTQFNALTGNTDDYYPEPLRNEIDTINDRIYHNVNNGVYRSGFARNQSAYEDAVTGLFEVLDELEQRLAGADYLVGGQLTEADIRLVPTLLRFDLVYYVHFKCSRRRISDYPNLYEYLKSMYALPAVRSTTNFEHIKRHYYYSHESINPFRIVPLIEPNLG